MTTENEIPDNEHPDKVISTMMLEWIKTPPELYDVEAAYEERISPLIDQIIAISREVGMPLFIECGLGLNDDGGIKLANTFSATGIGRVPKTLMGHLLYRQGGARSLERLEVFSMMRGVLSDTIAAHQAKAEQQSEQEPVNE